MAIGSLSFSLLLSLLAFAYMVNTRALLLYFDFNPEVHDVVNFTWIQFGTSNVDLGWVLDPLSA
ncbi:MAG TPA: hypothetical protein VKF63_10905, partial [Terracidiphilus sp.]|nr:hypothetical protein [Terracidiphilus sp.]